MLRQSLTIPAKYCGPPHSANGGYAAGLLASQVDGPCSVTLRAPPPLDRPLELSRTPEGLIQLHDAQTLLADAQPIALELELPEPVSFADAERASQGYPGTHPHPYPRCYVCGPARPRGDGLGIYAWAVEGRRVVAAPWVPSADLCSDGREVDAKFVWAALDCPSWFGFCAFESDVPLVLLGRLSGSVTRRPGCDEQLVAMGWHVAREGRRIECGSMIVDPKGECLAFAKSTWIALKRPAA